MGFPIPDIGSVVEDTGVLGGQITDSGDINFWIGSDAGQWTADTITGAYGSQLVIDTDGNWIYTASNSNAAIQALNTGDTLTEVFTVHSTAGNSTITITINGLDEPPCFVHGTLINTPYGPRLIEDLRAGDTVLTRDNGPQKLRWIGSKEISSQGHENYEKLRPVRILKNSFGKGVPAQDLLVSPMHRVLVCDPLAGLLFGQEEILCAAKLLINGRNIYRDSANAAVYYHMLFDAHEIVISNDCPSESFYPGRVGLSAFEAETRDEVFALFPELRSLPESYGKTARYTLRGYEAKVLAKSLPGSSPLLNVLSGTQKVA